MKGIYHALTNPNYITLFNSLRRTKGEKRISHSSVWSASRYHRNTIMQLVSHMFMFWTNKMDFGWSEKFWLWPKNAHNYKTEEIYFSFSIFARIYIYIYIYTVYIYIYIYKYIYTYCTYIYIYIYIVLNHNFPVNISVWRMYFCCWLTALFL